MKSFKIEFQIRTRLLAVKGGVAFQMRQVYRWEKSLNAVTD